MDTRFRIKEKMYSVKIYGEDILDEITLKFRNEG